MSARTFGELLYRIDRWVMRGAEPHVVIRLKHLFPRIPKEARGPFEFADTPLICRDLEWFETRYPMAMSARDRERLTETARVHDRVQAEMEEILLPSWRPPAVVGLRPGQALRGYQSQAVEVAKRSGGLLLGDEVGLGKTYTAAGLLASGGALPAVVVCHVHIMKQWIDVLERFTTLSVHGVTKASPYNLPPADVYVVPYSRIGGWIDVLPRMGIRGLILDEPRELRTGAETAKGAGCMAVSMSASVRLGLSATPIMNYGRDIFNVLSFIRPDALGDQWDFHREWLGAFGRLTDPAALGTYLRECRAFLRRAKADVGKELAPVNRIVDRVDHDEAAVRSIEEKARSLALRATTGTFFQRGEAARELDLMVRMQTGVAKAAAVADVARIIVEGGSPVLLVGWHRAVYDIWLDRLRDLRPAMYTGSESTTAKERSKAAFVSGETDLLIMSLRSGVGLDGLQERCSWVVFGELDWSPGIHHQVIGRLDREGQRDPVNALFLVADDGSDPPMMEVLGLKASEAAWVVDPALGATSAASDATNLRKLVERYLDKKGQPELREEAA